MSDGKKNIQGQSEPTGEQYPFVFREEMKRDFEWAKSMADNEKACELNRKAIFFSRLTLVLLGLLLLLQIWQWII